ncbi:DUF2975 domain-containing protein [Krasilnikovia sp. MM14-A1259]|uniref:DUF2975 domain-containing protein n=1 Tax=Krasilnikovia sp. MM14-A1259 TaxID=3373539 RepID=UPI0038118B29
MTIDGTGLDGPDSIAGLRPGIHLARGTGLRAVVDHPTTRQVVWHVGQRLPWFLLAMFTLAALLLVVRAARRGDPFSVANVRRLQALGWVLTVGSVVAAGVELLAAFALSSTITTGAPNATASLPIFWAFGGLCVLALSEVVKRGLALREDLATVI